MNSGKEKVRSLKQLIKTTTKCSHTSIYSQITFICRRLVTSHVAGRVAQDEAAGLIFDAHYQLTHRGFPVQVVAEDLHKQLDKLEGNNRSQFGVIMANTNSSVQVRGGEEEAGGRDGEGVSPEKQEDHKVNSSANAVEEEAAARAHVGEEGKEKYSEGYWADVI